jgi:predicted RNA binding protein YcfA (HicA-like mRNA interferase family)
MKLPRDVSGPELARRLRPMGYEVVGQHGSHMQLMTTVRGQQRITIPAHEWLKVGTIEFILTTVAQHLGVDRHGLILRLFGRAA